MCWRGAALVEYFRKLAYRLFWFQALVFEISFVVVPLCWSLLNPDLFLSVVLHFKQECAILTHLC